MTAIPKGSYEDRLCTTTTEIEQNCISLEESRRRVQEMVHKHFHK